MEKLCSICKVAVDSDDAPILAMGDLEILDIYVRVASNILTV